MFCTVHIYSTESTVQILVTVIIETAFAKKNTIYVNKHFVSNWEADLSILDNKKTSTT